MCMLHFKGKYDLGDVHNRFIMSCSLENLTKGITRCDLHIVLVAHCKFMSKTNIVFRPQYASDSFQNPVNFRS